MKCERERNTAICFMAACMVACAANAFGYGAAPAEGSMGYEFYSFCNQFTTSGYMYGVGIIGALVTIYLLFHTNLKGVLFTMAATYLAIRPQSLVTGFGYLF